MTQKAVDDFYGQRESFVEYMSRLVVVTKIPFIRHTTKELHGNYIRNHYTEHLPYLILLFIRMILPSNYYQMPP